MKSGLNQILSNPFRSNLNQSISFLCFRVLVSLSMINTHGLKKLLDFDATVQHIPDPLGIGGEVSAAVAIIANIVAPLFVILGLGTRIAVLPILSVTLIGLFVVHVNDPWVVKDVPLMYSLAYLLIFFMGAGKYALDYKFFKIL
ncbi:MAG: DoxX family protein [Flavobacteriaceae bacterium]|nr:DoxX family protein [Flavobacteriaceae bacterium]